MSEPTQCDKCGGGPEYPCECPNTALDFAAAHEVGIQAQDTTNHSFGMWRSLELQARAYAERRVAEAVAPYQALVAAVKEWQEARKDWERCERFPEPCTRIPERGAVMQRFIEVGDALATLSLPEQAP